jgi:hypothetical protein
VKALRHILEQPFIAATGLAALVHSTWALATLFAGEQPDSTAQLIGWLVPALLIAFALDVGQVATSVEIRQHGLTTARAVTFLVFAVATYYLQWLYIAHHMPALPLAPGVADTWKEAATTLRDAAVWIIPVLLPLSTLLYTFSGGEQRQPRLVESGYEQRQPRLDESPAIAAATEPIQQQPQLAEVVQEREAHYLPGFTPVSVENAHVATCESCGWTKTYTSDENARRGLAVHQARHCPARHPEFSTNGHHEA